MTGGNGEDHLIGSGANDLFFGDADGYFDVIGGAAGTDTSHAGDHDNNDLLTSVEVQS
jgi:hypothetical protein